MFQDRLTVLAGTPDRCRIITPFGEASGTVTFCDGEEIHFRTDHGKLYRLYVIDIMALEEFPTVPHEVVEESVVAYPVS